MIVSLKIYVTNVTTTSDQRTPSANTETNVTAKSQNDVVTTTSQQRHRTTSQQRTILGGAQFTAAACMRRRKRNDRSVQSVDEGQLRWYFSGDDDGDDGDDGWDSDELVRLIGHTQLLSAAVYFIFVSCQLSFWFCAKIMSYCNENQLARMKDDGVDVMSSVFTLLCTSRAQSTSMYGSGEMHVATIKARRLIHMSRDYSVE